MDADDGHVELIVGAGFLGCRLRISGPQGTAKDRLRPAAAASAAESLRKSRRLRERMMKSPG